MNRVLSYLSSLVVCMSLSSGLESSEPIADAELVFAERNGIVAVEAEHFFSQEEADVRAFHLTTADQEPGIKPDPDPPHVGGASGGAYLEILPDTRRNHGDKLIRGENFAPEAGKMAILKYKIHFVTTGRYYVWVRAHSTGSEDNGLHVGIDGAWPATGQRLQWCQGKRTWRWESKQRTEKEHCGEPHKIYLDINEPGEHVIHFSMREDGFEFDKFLMTTDRSFARPDGVGPPSLVRSGKPPKAFRFVEAPPVDVESSPVQPQPDPRSSTNSDSQALSMPATMFAQSKLDGYYLDRKQWLAVNPEKNQVGAVSRTFPYPTGTYHVTLQAVGENDGSSRYKVTVDDRDLGKFTCPLSDQMYQEGAKFSKTWKDIQITEGAMIGVQSEIGSADGKEYSRARWASVRFLPADDQTRRLTANIRQQQRATQSGKNRDRSKSPTVAVSDRLLQQPRQPDGDGSVMVTGQTQVWHKITLSLAGPYAHEKDNRPNPFTDYRMTVEFRHDDGTSYTVPGYFAADGKAADSSAESGIVWRAHFAPDRAGRWQYRVHFVQGDLCALVPKADVKPVRICDGIQGILDVTPSDKSGRDLRAHGRLQYVGKHYLQFAGSGKYFLKVGADAPETLLAYADFDNTIAGNPKKAPLKTWEPHLRDWSDGDPTWQDGKGKGLIGAVNYLSAKGCNAFSFLTYNAGGDGDNVWPFIQREDKLHYDCSKLDQWGIVFDHATRRGMYLHFKMQETENDDHKKGKGGNSYVPECLDGGNLGVQRRLYCRELIARFGHNLALNWNLGEENTQTNTQHLAMIDYIAAMDSYDHNIVIHTFPNEQEKVYQPLLGDKSKLTGASLQNSSIATTHAHALRWVNASAEAGRPWVVAFDESGSAAHGQCPDLGYRGFDGRDRTGKMAYDEHAVRKQTLWGTLMAGGAGCEYYFGYQFAENDIVCEDWRSRDRSWDYCRIATEFFHQNKIPFWEMKNADSLISTRDGGDTDVAFCFAKAGEVYLVYFASATKSRLNLADTEKTYSVLWFNPRTGGQLAPGTVRSVKGGAIVDLGAPPSDLGQDWLAVLKAR